MRREQPLDVDGLGRRAPRRRRRRRGRRRRRRRGLVAAEEGLAAEDALARRPPERRRARGAAAAVAAVVEAGAVGLRRHAVAEGGHGRRAAVGRREGPVPLRGRRRVAVARGLGAERRPRAERFQRAEAQAHARGAVAQLERAAPVERRRQLHAAVGAEAQLALPGDVRLAAQGPFCDTENRRLRAAHGPAAGRRRVVAHGGLARGQLRGIVGCAHGLYAEHIVSPQVFTSASLPSRCDLSLLQANLAVPIEDGCQPRDPRALAGGLRPRERHGLEPVYQHPRPLGQRVLRPDGRRCARHLLGLPLEENGRVGGWGYCGAPTCRNQYITCSNAGGGPPTVRTAASSVETVETVARRSTASPARTGPTTRPTARTARSSSTCPTTTRSRTGPSRARTAASPGAARGDARRRRRVRLRLHAAHGRRLRRHLPRAGHPGAVDQVRLLQRQVAHPAHVRRGRRLRADAQQRAEPVARPRPTCPMGNAAPRASLEGATGLLRKHKS